MTGLWEQMQNSNRVEIKPFSADRFLASLDEAIKREHQRPRTTVIQTGRFGMVFFDLTIQLRNIKWWSYTPKRIPGLIEISLWKKHGLCKVRYYYTRESFAFTAVYGARILGKATDIQSAINLLKSYYE